MDSINSPDAALDNLLGKLFEIADPGGSGFLIRDAATELLFTATGGNNMDEIFSTTLGDSCASLDMASFKNVALVANGDASRENLAASVKVEIAKLVAADPDAAWTAACGKVHVATSAPPPQKLMRTHT
jgi:hypothetical protein